MNDYSHSAYITELRTPQRFTGQQSDGTGLIYMNARYYDRSAELTSKPHLGQFISPDALVPDANNVFDYNRYMYARGNPMKYNDPSGHCVTNKDGSRAKSDMQCWQLVDTISAIWNQHPNYWDQRFKVSNESWLEKVAAAQPFDSKYMNNELNLYLHSDSFKSDFGFTPAGYTPNPVTNDQQALENLMNSSAAQKLQPAVEVLVHPDCNNRDCVAIVLDTVGVIGSAVKYGAPLCGAAAAGCAKVGGFVSNTTTVVGAGWTVIQRVRGHASNDDLSVTVVTAFTGLAGDTPTSLRAGLVQSAWDTIVSPVWNTLWR